MFKSKAMIKNLGIELFKHNLITRFLMIKFLIKKIDGVPW
jgi:hypothetical protein